MIRADEKKYREKEVHIRMDYATYMKFMEIYEFQKSCIKGRSKNDTLIELIQDGFLVFDGVMVSKNLEKEEN